MTVYSYSFTSGSSNIITYKIEKSVGILPLWVSQSSGFIHIAFNSDLTLEQKTALDTLMADANAGLIPANTGNTNVTIDDIVDLRSVLTAESGLDCDIYPIATGWIIQFKKVLTNAEKNKLTNYFAKTLRFL